ncbi:MAG TPA: DUF4383 domain-containing protein [Candidatus Limnocylindrales bacterium]
MTVHTAATTRSINQIVGWVAGTVFIAVGLLGFTVSGGHDAAGIHGGELLGIFQVNMLHNFVHLLVGAALIVGAMAGARAAKTVNVLVGVVYLAVGALGLFILDSSVNILALNGYDNWLHLFSGAALVGIGLWSDKR